MEENSPHHQGPTIPTAASLHQAKKYSCTSPGTSTGNVVSIRNKENNLVTHFSGLCFYDELKLDAFWMYGRGRKPVAMESACANPDGQAGRWS